MVRSVSFILVLTLVIGACGDQERSERRKKRKLDKVEKINQVFETSEPYSPKKLDSLMIEEHIQEHEGEINDPAGIRDFYERREYQYAWFVDDSLSESAASFLALINSDDTLHSAVAALRDQIRRMIHRPTDDEKVEDLELALTAKFFSFASTKYGGLLDQDHLHDLHWYIPKRKKDYNKLLDSLAAGKMDLSDVEPVSDQYKKLKAHLKKFHQLAQGPWETITLTSRKKLEPGKKASEVPAIRERLIQLGDLVAVLDTLADTVIYDTAMVAAVRAHQQRNGLAVDGVIGPNFLEVINTPPAERLRTILVNMERLRWMPENVSDDVVLVNIPEFKLHVLKNDSLQMSMDVVVGTAADRTIIFSDTISYIVFSPTWTLPQSITQEEILPKLEEDDEYLEKNNMKIIGGSKEEPIIQQEPGPTNSLGQVKFMFPNSYSIYLHDTPAKSLFGRDQRALSHGCIRLSKPKEFAKYLLRNDTTWTDEKIDEAMNLGEEVNVGLKDPQPVMITYFTAWVDDKDRLHFRRDIYGHDERLGKELFNNEAPIAAKRSALDMAAPIN